MKLKQQIQNLPTILLTVLINLIDLPILSFGKYHDYRLQAMS